MPVILPKQSVPLTEDNSNLLRKAWYLPLNDLADAVNTGTGGGGEGGRGGGASVVGLLDVTLSAGITTTINPTAPIGEGSCLVVCIKAKGPTAILAWGANVKWAPTDIRSITDTWTVIDLFGRIDPADATLKWFCKGVRTGIPS